MSSPNGRATTPNQARSRGRLLIPRSWLWLFQHPSRLKERWWIRLSPPPRSIRRWEPAPVRSSTRSGTPPRAGEGGAQGDRGGKPLSPERRRAAVCHLMRTMKVSERFACRVTGQNRSTQRRSPAATTPADPDAGVRLAARLGRAPSATRPQVEAAVGAGDNGDGARLVGDLGGGPGHALDATPAGCCGCAGTGCRGRSGA
jgi:hypothetical protein